MRKLLAPAVSAAVAIFAVALMAGAGIQSNAKAAAGPDRVFAALKVKQRQARLRHARRWHRERVKPAAAIPPGVASALQSIAACESGGNPRAVGGGGTYRGKYQFTYSTWASVGGSGDPAAAPEAEQDRRAAMLYARDGRSQWPVCGR